MEYMCIMQLYIADVLTTKDQSDGIHVYNAVIADVLTTKDQSDGIHVYNTVIAQVAREGFMAVNGPSPRA